ncbi:MAG: hypothetical protein M1820_001530 [Bogoriella megaspora]|nr:MAG: hypothetical protein M1820_001530 [Bogoriella megaspora]
MTSAKGYTTEQYLLDRAHIHDTLTYIYYAADSREWDLLLTHVLAPEVTIDYSEYFGWEPTTRTAKEQQKVWEDVTNPMPKTQHVITSIIPVLPAPGANTSIPEKAQAKANVFVHLSKKLENGETIKTRNGGRMEAELTRHPDLAEKSNGNPWRLSGFKAYAGFDENGAEFWGTK